MPFVASKHKGFTKSNKCSNRFVCLKSGEKKTRTRKKEKKKREAAFEPFASVSGQQQLGVL